ncbi:MAG: LacI family DNA-binding transcriptional regulator [Pseudopedobacter sp.]|nr:LacI family DNA-binding transcriptional regulator [Deinococcales bacterium]
MVCLSESQLLCGELEPSNREVGCESYVERTKHAMTLTDVARAAGVSPSTVSRILSGTARVTPETRQRVMVEIKRLNYQPNVLAQGLKRGHSRTVGVLTQELNSPFFNETVQGIEYGFEDSGYDPIFSGGHSRKSEERRALDVLRSRRVDALIVVGSFLPDALLLELAKETILVMVGRRVSGLEAQCVFLDNVQGGLDATTHLTTLGHRRIAFVTGNNNHPDSAERFQGYCTALSTAGIPFDPQLVVAGDFGEQSGLMAVDALLSQGVRFTALFAANDQMACGARLALYRRGIRVPDDISLIGFDDLKHVLYAIPPLTTVRQPMLEMGQCAARLALNLLEGKSPPEHTFSPTLVVRESTAMAR